MPDSSLRGAVVLALSQSNLRDSLQSMRELKSLAAPGFGVSDLTGIGLLQSLEFLNLSDNQISDLSPLSGLDNLSVLDVSLNQVVSLSVLGELPALSVLILDGNPVTDLSPLLRSSVRDVSLLGISVSDALIDSLTAAGIAVHVPTEPSLPPDPSPSADLSSLSIRAVAVDGDVWVIAADVYQGETVLVVSRDDGVSWTITGEPLATHGIQPPVFVSIAARLDTMILMNGRSGWRATDTFGQSWFQPDGIATGFAIYFPVIFPEVTMESPTSDRGWLTDVASLRLYETDDNGQSWLASTSGIIAHSYDVASNSLLIVSRSSISIRRESETEVVAERDDLLLTGELIGRQLVLAASRDRLEWIDLGNMEVDTVLVPQEGRWGAALVRWNRSLPQVIHLLVADSLPDDYEFTIDSQPFREVERRLWRSVDMGRSWDLLPIVNPIDVVISSSGRIGILTDQGLQIEAFNLN